MIIRFEQFAVLGAEQRRSFLERMIGHLDETYPKRIQDKYGAETIDFVNAGIAKAQEYGIEFEGDIESFLDMRVEWGPEFDVTQAWAAAILTDKRYKGSDKIVLLKEHERFGI